MISFKAGFFRSFPLLLLSVSLLFGVQLSARQAAAQGISSNPSGPSAAGSASESSGASSTGKKSEAEERNVYRHSATVQWFARLFHVDVETAAASFEYINFGIVVLAIGIPLFRIVPGALRKRSARLSFDLEVAQARTDDANTRLRAVEGQLAGLDGEIAALRKQMEEDTRADEARSKSQLAEETARIVAAAEQEIDMAGALAQRELRQFAGDLAVDRASKQLTLDSETDRALFAEFAADVAGKPSGTRGRSKGGRN